MRSIEAQKFVGTLERNQRITELGDLGLSLSEIAKIIKREFNCKMSRQRVGYLYRKYHKEG